MGIEVVFDDYLVRKQAALDHKNIDFKQSPYWIFSKGSTHDFGQKMALYLCMFLDKWALKYCLMIIEVENTPS